MHLGRRTATHALLLGASLLGVAISLTPVQVRVLWTTTWAPCLRLLPLRDVLRGRGRCPGGRGEEGLMGRRPRRTGGPDVGVVLGSLRVPSTVDGQGITCPSADFCLAWNHPDQVIYLRTGVWGHREQVAPMVDVSCASASRCVGMLRDRAAAAATYRRGGLDRVPRPAEGVGRHDHRHLLRR